MSLMTFPVKETDDPQIVIERLAQKRVSEEAAERYFTRRISKGASKPFASLVLGALKETFSGKKKKILGPA